MSPWTGSCQISALSPSASGLLLSLVHHPAKSQHGLDYASVSWLEQQAADIYCETFSCRRHAFQYSVALKGHSLERTPLYKGHKIWQQVLWMRVTFPLIKGHLSNKDRFFWQNMQNGYPNIREGLLYTVRTTELRPLIGWQVITYIFMLNRHPTLVLNIMRIHGSLNSGGCHLNCWAPLYLNLYMDVSTI